MTIPVGSLVRHKAGTLYIVVEYSHIDDKPYKIRGLIRNANIPSATEGELICIVEGMAQAIKSLAKEIEDGSHS